MKCAVDPLAATPSCARDGIGAWLSATCLRERDDMELSTFAERILFGTDLDEKLLSPESVTDFLPTRLENIPDYPGRPTELRLQGDGPKHKVAFPGLHELHQERTRGHVLHFFANHELLALELMALMLLRFPEAPASFRMGIFQTMVEEQGHLRMYRERMELAGVEFGEIPVNAFFWRTLRDVESPLEFVTGMSMTFEQANLDYAGYYARAFRRVGDIETADVLDIVYEEEIGHVKHGVVWFDRWRPKEGSRFRAFEVLLPEGISPIRAKGNEFDREARQLAGLDDDYIERLRLFRASKGRPPWVLHFNPAVEEENRFGPTWQAPKVLHTVAADFALLMGQLASEEDILLVERAPSDATKAYLDDVGLPLPAVLEVKAETDLADTITSRHIGRLMPWGVSPVSAARFNPLFERLVGEERANLDRWNDTIRSWGKDEIHPLRVAIADELRATLPERYASRIYSGDELGWRVESVAELEALLVAEAARPLVVKASRGASGRGSTRIFEPGLSDGQRTWAERMLRLDGALVVERWRQRAAEISWQIDVGEETTTHYGALRCLIDARGQYQGAVLHRMTAGLETDLVRWIHDDGRSSRWLRNAQERVGELVGEGLRARGYRGPAGIDAMITREGDSYRFHPMIETNTRLTMGRVALQLERRVARRRLGAMLLLPVSAFTEAHGGVAAARRWAETHHPPHTVGAGPEKSVDGGIVWLTDVEQAVGHLAVMLVAPDWEQLLEIATGLAPQARTALEA